MSNIATTNINFSEAVESSVTATNADMTASETVQDTATTEGASVLEDETADEGKIRIPGFEVLGFAKKYGSDELSITMSFENPFMNLKQIVTIPIRDVQRTAKFRNAIPPTFVIPGCSPAKQIEVLQNEINQSMCRSDIPTKEALPQGFSFVGNELFYVMADTIFPAADYEKDRSVLSAEYIAENPGGTKSFLPTSEARKIKLERAIDWVRLYCQQGPAQTVLFLCAMTPYMKHILPEGFSGGSAIPAFVVGQTGFGKTEQIKLLRTTDGVYGLNLESDMKEIWAGLADFRDRAVQIDDLNKTGSNAVKENKEKKVYSLLQAGNSAAGKVCSKDVNVDLGNTALLISAEYVLPNYSTINRALLLHIREAFNPETLTWLQQNRAFYGRFLVHFISMICSHREEFKQILTEYHEDEPFQIPNVDAPEEYAGFPRVHRHYKILRLTAHAIECLIPDSDYTKFSSMFKEATDVCIKDTLEAIRKNAVTDFVKSFLRIFEQDIVAESPKEYCYDKRFLFFLHKEYLYFRGKNLTDYFLAVYSQTVSAKTISKELGKAGLLVMYGNSYSEKLPKKLDEKVGGEGEHYYRINTNVLLDKLYNANELMVYLGFPIVHMLKSQENEAKKREKERKEERKKG